MLKNRVITGAVLFLIVLAAVFLLPPRWFQLVVGLIFLFACWEWTALLPLKHPATRVLYIIVMAAFCIFTFGWLPLMLLIAAIFWIWAVAAVIVFACGKKPLGFEQPIAKMIFGIIAFAALYDSLLMLRALDHLTQIPWLLMILVVVSMSDIGAYFAGRFWGGKLLAPRASPKKTWAGFWGGLVASILVSVIFTGVFLHLLLIDNQQFWRINLSVLIAVVFGVFGDLFESMLKRQVNLKDSGSILPGHGGLLDRMDSLFPSVPIFVLIGFMNFFG